MCENSFTEFLVNSSMPHLFRKFWSHLVQILKLVNPSSTLWDAPVYEQLNFFSFEANLSWHTDRCKRTFKTSWREYISWWLVSTITLSPWFIKHSLFLMQSSTKGISSTSVFIMFSCLSMRSDDQDHVMSVTALCTTALKFMSYCVKCYSFTPQLLYQHAFLDKKDK